MSQTTRVLICSLFSWLPLFHLVTGMEVDEGALHRANPDQVYDQLHSIELGLVVSNDSVFLDAFSPWSYEPVCTAKLSEIGSELCVYTDRDFSNGRGISIFTTPEVAGEIAAALASLKDPPMLGDTLGTINTFTGAWYTHPVRGKGIGTLAKRDLHRGDMITAYTPVLLAYEEDILPRDERETFLRLAIAQLPAPSREASLKLATISEDPSMMLAQDIASANAFEMRLRGRKASGATSPAAAAAGDEAAAAHLAIIPEASRMNHDCAPNAIFYNNVSTLAHVVRATRPIRAGEEITVAYINPLDPRATRQKYLSAAFGFTCTCSRCLRDADADAILTEIATLQATLSHWSDANSPASVKHVEGLIRLYRSEGLDGYLDVAYCYAALMYSAVGSVRGARKYLALAIEAIELRLGPGAPDLPAWRDMSDNPTGHWSWTIRKGKRGSGDEMGK